MAVMATPDGGCGGHDRFMAVAYEPLAYP